MSEFDDSLDFDAADGSANDEAVNGKTVPAERFNGLQRKLQEALAENKALKESRKSPASEREDSVTQPDPRDELLTELALENWRAKAVRKYPAVAKFEDLLAGASLKDVLAVAEDLNNRLAPEAAESPAGPEPTPEAPAEQEQPSEMPSTGGAAQVPPPNLDEELDAARARAIRNGDWSEVLRLKYKQQGINT